MKKWVLWAAPGLALVVLGLAACASAPAPAVQAEAAPAPPGWVLNPPESDASYMYFTASGASRAGSLAEGEEAARLAVLDEIMRYLGVRITSDTTATARASLESFQADVVQQLRQSSSARVVGLEIAERWVQEREGAVTVYLLARYDRRALQQEKQRLEALFQEKVEAVSAPEREGRSLEERGLYYQAALAYLEAAAAAFKSELENADIKFERNLNQAREALRRIALVKMNDDLQVYVGEPFPEPFRLRVVAGSGGEDAGLSEVAVRVVYKERKGSGREAVRTARLKSDAGGGVLFQHPPAELAGRGQVTMALDLGDALETLESVPERLYPQVEALQQLVAGKQVRFTFEASSRAASIPTGVAVFDLDASGNPIALTETLTGLLEELGRASFKVSPLAAGVGGIANRSDAQVVTFLQRNFSGQVQRAIFGTARISDHAQDGQFVIIQVTGSVKVADLQSGRILLAVNKSKRAQGNNTSSALAAAFKKLGEDMGQEIVAQLR